MFISERLSMPESDPCNIASCLCKHFGKKSATDVVSQAFLDVAASLTADAEDELRGFFAAELPAATSRRAATSAMCALLAEPLAYDYTRRLLTSEADSVAQELNHIAGQQSPTRWPSEGAAFCSVRQARNLYQPALARRVQLLLQASADPNGMVLGQSDWHCPPQSPLMPGT
eukprot:s450_g17.t1